MKRSFPDLRILAAFFVWRLLLFFAAFLSVFLIPVFGNRFPYWDRLLLPTGLPSWIWGFGNFDGVHYIRIAQLGYESSDFSQAFFPLYPLLIKIFNFTDNYFLTSFILANLFLIIALYFLYKLFRVDYDSKISSVAVIFLLAFPTAFYLGAAYSESLFLLLTAASLLMLRKKRYLPGGIFGGLASATRIFGIILLLVLLVELYLDIKKGNLKMKGRDFAEALSGIFLIPLGLVSYMLYLKFQFNNPLYFLSSQPMFGAERSSSFIFLPQVLFRYLKMLFVTPVSSLSYFNVVLELGFTLVFIYVLFLTFRKIRPSYWIFMFGCLILPTLTGTLSSVPRYSLMSFLAFPFLVEKFGINLRWIAALFIVLEAVLLSMFIRGYWVA